MTLLSNTNVRSLVVKGSKIEAKRPATGTGPYDCPGYTELCTVESVRRYKDGRTHVLVVTDGRENGFTIAFPEVDENTSDYRLV